MVVEAIPSEPVSTFDTQFTGNLQGIWPNFGLLGHSLLRKHPLFQSLSRQIPYAPEQRISF